MSSTDSGTQTKSSGRLAALDGLRGLAALVVVLHHTMLLNANFPASPGEGSLQPGTPLWWMSYTPLKLATAGWESVIVFFVLSGLVVTLPVVKRPGFDWIAYYPRRVMRLMIPVVGAVLVAAAFVVAIPQRSLQPSGTWLSNSSTPNFTWEYIVKAWDLVGGNGHIDNPLWSLRWEILFSLALPVFVILAISLRKWWSAGLAAAVVVTWLGVRAGSGAFSFFPAFFVGAVLAVRLDAVRLFAGRINRFAVRHLIWLGLTIGASALLISPWLFGPGAGSELTAALRAFAPLAAAGLVLCAVGWKPLGGLLSSPPFAFAGRISFSLYLVHVPILIFSAYLLAGQPLYVVALVGIPLAILVAVGFTWLVEARSHQWARAAGAWASARYAAAFRATEPERERPQLTERGDEGRSGKAVADAATGQREAATPAQRSRAS
ncbi:acyltransferase family protein [Diaminobutyricibacter tongyongensis]|uniref:acyltransferase family protein n=1 Tax=Leifsonia tongyongensis TaxID=1268043 RepID=UPI001F0391C4|nr:acyltransferase [Diaminobutyricibacter tongyongensis]